MIFAITAGLCIIGLLLIAFTDYEETAICIFSIGLVGVLLSLICSV